MDAGIFVNEIMPSILRDVRMASSLRLVFFLLGIAAQECAGVFEASFSGQ
jgi:hypothetical protein